MWPAMSQPREIAPGATYLITRRVLRRHLLFRPDAAITQLLVYALAVSARRYGIEVHALCAMSTHLHLVVTDVQGVLPRFLQFFHRIVALGTKVLRKWEGPVWDHEATSVVRLLTHAAVVEKIAYVLANPVAAGLVRHAREWPGAKVDVGEIGRGVLHAARVPRRISTRRIRSGPRKRRSRSRCRRRSSRTARRAFAVTSPPSSSDRKRRPMRRCSGEGSASWAPNERARSPPTIAPRASRRCAIAIRRSQSAVSRVARGEPRLPAVRAFRASYRAALERWCAGVRSAVFPAGTWWMRMFHGVSVNDVVLAG